MLFCILLFIILSFALRLPAERWRDTRVMIGMVFVSLGLMMHNIVDGLLVAIWYIVLISDYGKMLKINESFDDDTTCNIYVPPSNSSNVVKASKVNNQRKALWDNTYKKFTDSLSTTYPYNSKMLLELQNAYDLQNPSKYRYNNDLDSFSLNL